MRAGLGLKPELTGKSGPMTDDLEAAAKHRILIVDDDQHTRSGLKRFFERANYDVLAVSTFADGRQALVDARPDFLIADVRLGEYNGLQLIATNPRWIPTIVVTGYADPVLEADARRLGADYLLKPISPTALIAMVKQKLESFCEAGLPFTPGRRSTRKPLTGDLPAHVGDVPARIVDLSYGGIGFEISEPQAHPLSSQLAVVLPDVTIAVDLVWTRRSSQTSWMCGAALAAGQLDTARAWQRIVDEHTASPADAR